MNLKSLFSLLPPRVPRHTAADQRAIRRRAVSQTSNGNVLLQFGRYATEEDIADRRRQVLVARK